MDSARALTTPEIAAVWAPLAKAWDITPDSVWWFPLVPTVCAGVVAFESSAFHAALGPTWVRRVLAARGVERVIHFPEFDHLLVADMPVEQAAFRYDGAEGYWCDARPGARDWLVYASHEESITLGGEWLVAEVQRAWPEWADQLWNHAPDSYRPSVT